MDIELTLLHKRMESETAARGDDCNVLVSTVRWKMRHLLVQNHCPSYSTKTDGKIGTLCIFNSIKGLTAQVSSQGNLGAAQ